MKIVEVGSRNNKIRLEGLKMSLGGDKIITRYAGKQVITSPYLTKMSEPFSAKRSWKERLFTRPWQPFKSTKMITEQIPSDEVLLFDGKIVIHPITLEKLKFKLELDKNESH